MYKALLFTLLSILFIGCSNSSALNYFKTDDLKARVIQYTKKVDLISNNNQEALIWATYLNNVKDKNFEFKNDTFLISLYFVDNETKNLKNSGYTISLNGQEPIEIIKIEKNDPKYKVLLENNPWGQYYIVSFKSKKRVYDLNLRISNSNISSAQLKFQK